MKLTPEDKLLLSVVKISPSIEELDQINILILLIQDWDYFTNMIIERGSAPLFYKKLPLLKNSTVIPPHVKAKLQQAYYITFSRSSLLYEQFNKVAKLFSENNIPVIALKGIYLSEWLYQDIGLRQFSDIDLFVHEEDGRKCISLLKEIGFRSAAKINNLSEFVENQMGMVHYPAMVMDGVSIEIHIKLHRKSEKYNLKLDEIWKNAVPITICNAPALTLNDTDLLIYLCLHLDKHFKNGHVQFTCFNDITNLLDKYAETIIWEDFVKSCVSYKCESIVFKYFVLVNKYMNASLPTEIVEKYNSYLTNNDEQLFLKYLNGFQGIASGVSGHLVSIKKLNTITLKIKYVLDIIFPSRKFMIEKYGLAPNPLKGTFWWLWYPYRWWVGVKGVFKLILAPNP
jgi:hypothetical protein